MRRAIFALGSLALLGGCYGGSATGGAGGAGGGCPNDLPASCPSPAPGYARDAAPVLKARCVSCHSPGGNASDRPLASYSDVFRQRSGVLDQAYSCRMPTAGSAPLTLPERAALLGWLVCGAKQD